MIDALFDRFDVAVKHGAGAAAAHVVPDAVDIEPFRRALLTAAKFVAHLRIEYFRAASGKRAKTGLAENGECVRNRTFKDPLSEMADFNGRECLDRYVRIKAAEPLEQFEIPLLGQRRMQAADHVDFRDAPGQ